LGGELFGERIRIGAGIQKETNLTRRDQKSNFPKRQDLRKSHKSSPKG